MFSRERVRPYLMLLLGSAIQAFGLYNIHAVADVTEGGVAGLTLLLRHWLGVSPALSGLALNALCYALGWRTLGRGFLRYSLVASGGFSLFYFICEQFDPLWPRLAALPLPAAVLGALFIGLGAGLCVRAGGASCGDDALAMGVSHVSRLPIQWIYLISDVSVLALSATYIPLGRLLCSLLTVVLSGQLIGAVQRFRRPGKADRAEAARGSD